MDPEVGRSRLIESSHSHIDLIGRALSPRLQPEGLYALVKRLAPGGRLLRTRRLTGGLGCRSDVLDIEGADGKARKFTLRRFVRADHAFSTPDHVAHEFRILQLVERARIPAPRPIMLDAEGELFGVPAIVISYLPGRPLFPTTNIERWTEDLASALLTVHAVTPDRFDLSWLGVRLYDGMRATIDKWREEARADPLAAEIHSVLEAALDRIEFSNATLVHDDFWSGNTVAYRGRIIGIIDWTSAEVGDPRTDVAECRVDMVLSHGIEVADAFRDDYERQSGRRLEDLWYFDLFRGFHAWNQYEHWLEGYHDMGLVHLKPSEVGARLRAFLRRAVHESATGRPSRLARL
jgi:aminoglycoside phosphotransferase (APT) family kinase protein